MTKHLPGLLISILAIVILAFAAAQAVRLYNQPLGVPLTANEQPGSVVSEPQSALKVDLKEIPLQKDEVCGNTGAVTFLFTGTGTAGNINSAEAIRILKVDFDQQKITVVAVPRDLWVDSRDDRVGENRLALIYDEKRKATNGSDKHKDTVATDLLLEILNDYFNFTPDKYFTLGLDPWGEMIDTIGGVEVELTEEFTTSDGTVIPAGKHLMDGKVSKDYIRLFLNAGDPGRIQRQNNYVKALREKVLNVGIIPKVPDLYKQFDKTIITDFSPKQLVDLACMVDLVPQESIEFYEIEGDMVTQREDGALVPDKEKIRDYLTSILYLE